MFEVYTTFFREKYLLTLTRKCGSRRGVFPKKVFFLPAEISYFTRFLTFPMSPPRGSGFDVLQEKLTIFAYSLVFGHNASIRRPRRHLQHKISLRSSETCIFCVSFEMCCETIVFYYFVVL